MATINPRKADWKVSSVMTKNVVSCRVSDNIREAAQLLVNNRIGGLPVVDETDVCVGILTAHDIVRFEIDRVKNDEDANFGLEADIAQDDQGTWQIGIEPLDRVYRFMNPAVQTIDENSTVELGAKAMRDAKIHHLVVLDEQRRPIGIVSSLDLLCLDCPVSGETPAVTSIKT